MISTSLLQVDGRRTTHSQQLLQLLRQLNLLADDNNKRINTILSELQKKTYKKGTIEQKLSDFYKLALNVDARNKAGISPSKPLLDEMEAAKTKADLQKIQLKYAAQGYGVSFGGGFGTDEKNVKMNIFDISVRAVSPSVRKTIM